MDDREIIFENQFVTIWYHNKKQIYHHEFKRFAFGKDFQEVLTTGLDTFKKKGSKKWLSDDRKNPIMTSEDMTWSTTEWRPRLFKTGLKYWAVVLPERVAGQLAMKRVVDVYKKAGVIVEVFEDPDKAIEWLDSQP